VAAPELNKSVSDDSAGPHYAADMNGPIKVFAAIFLATGAGAAGAQPGQTYRGVGTEPFWSITITPRTIRLEEPGRPAVEVATPRPALPRWMGRIYYAGRLHVAIRRQMCSDGMSDRHYEDNVTVEVDGRRLTGCGGAFTEPSRLANTHWRISAINGRSVPVDGPFHLDFTEDRLSGRAGCNRFSGGYRLEGQRLTPGPIMSTRMACIGPGMSLEAAAMRVLSGPLTVAQPSERRILLRGAGGSLTPEMVPGARPQSPR
jgi:heat shock protein HslJ